MSLFNKILIANRGEIAVRIIRAAKELNIMTVAVYSDADAGSLHVRMADEAYPLIGNVLSETYLNIPGIIEIARISGCEAIHPGYGFLSENPAFVAACESAGITFIGPDSRAMRLMGNKIESREFVKKLNIPMTAGITGDTETLLKESHNIELPVLVKAAAGGGGKGMRIVYNLDELPQILEATSREAKSYFGDGTIYIEKYIVEPRHIEVQVIGDNYGNVIHLFERECSIQRRYQKIVEESPSPTLTEEVRQKMTSAAVKIAKEIGYTNAGTVEFLVDKDLHFYFLEMNTRVQVEHPVTEMVTGIDIVKEQIRIASGEKLSIAQKDIKQNGHAIECRIYAEDPLNNFLPSPGKMSLFIEPHGSGIRLDSGINEAVTIHSFFDPMICKLITWDTDREKATRKMNHALDNFIIHGIRTNISYLSALIRLNAFRDNQISTRFCEQYAEEIIKKMEEQVKSVPFEFPVFAYTVYSLDKGFPARNHDSVWKQIGYWRDLMELTIESGKSEFKLEILRREKENYHITTSGKDYLFEAAISGKGQVTINYGDNRFSFHVSADEKGNGYVSFNGCEFQMRRSDLLFPEEFFGKSDHGSIKDSNNIFSPMPGKVLKIKARKGQQVARGAVLLIVEAMKMENNITSFKDAVVEKVHVAEGDMVDPSTELITLKDIE